MPRTIRAQAFERSGLLMIEPQALREFYFFGDEPRENTELGDAVIVDINGPLEQHSHFCFDSYEEILDRIRAACATPAKAVILRFDSPGGVAGGCFEATELARQICAETGKQLHAYVEGNCNSAAYAWAAACESITLGTSALCGSIGVLSARRDYSARNAANGVRIELVTSGARKADGHPDNPISDAELANTQEVVNALAQVFFAHVAKLRASLTIESIGALEAKVMHAAAALAGGLADEVGPLSAVLARIAGDGGGLNMAGSPYEKARAALEEAAKGSDPNAKAAKAALAALGGGEGEGGEKKEEPPADPPKEEGAPPAGDPPKEEPKKEEPAAAGGAPVTAEAAMRIALQTQRENAELKAKIAAKEEAEERRKLLSSKPMVPEMRALLEKSPMSLVRETIATLPDGPPNPQLEGAPLRGDTQDGSAPRMNAKDKQTLDERMGLAQRNVQAESTPFRLVLGGSSPKPKPADAAPPPNKGTAAN